MESEEKRKIMHSKGKKSTTEFDDDKHERDEDKDRDGETREAIETRFKQ